MDSSFVEERMNAAVFSFITPSVNSVIASVRIARFISKTLDIPLMWDDKIKRSKWDILILVNGAFTFCRYRDDLAVAVRKAKRIIWVQNDYVIYSPVSVGIAESTFRKSFCLRHDDGLPDMDHWTTVKSRVSKTKHGSYINWNALTALRTPLDCARNAPDDLFYYGSYRMNRARAFSHYFKSTKIPITLSSASKKFADLYPHVNIVASIPRGKFYHELNRHGLGLYIEDPRSHKEFHSPANRFYEMLSAGLPMVFEPDANAMLSEAGYDISDYIVERQRDARSFLKHRRQMQHQQNRLWWTDFRSQLTHDVRRAFRRYVHKFF
jgi:hypothetical protein